MPPEDYKEILEGITLVNLSLLETNAKIRENLKSFKKMNVKISDDATFGILDEEIVIKHNYSLSCVPVGKKQKVLSITVVFALHLTSEKEFNEDFFEIYKEMSLPLNTWPFFREFVNSTTARMNIPPLTLPLLKR